MNDIDRERFENFGSRLKGCELRMEDIDKHTKENYIDIRLDLAELRDNHFPHMEDRINNKIDSGRRVMMWVYGSGIVIVSILVALFGSLIMAGH